MTKRTDAAIEATGLRKAFGDVVALDGVDLHVPGGSVFALLGPNGSGKTTAVLILSTLMAPDAGSVVVAGHDLAREPDRVRAAIGVTGQFSAVDDLLTGRENLLLMADLHHFSRAEGRRRAAETLRTFELDDAGGRLVATYSGGMRRRLDLAMTLIGDPRIIFLDEPTTGLDPRSRRTLWGIIRGLATEGVTIFLTTQYLEEADRLAGRVAVLDHGAVVAEGSPDELKRLVGGGHVRLVFGDGTDLDAAVRLFGTLAVIQDDALSLQVPYDGTPHALRSLLDRLEDHDMAIQALSVHTPDLDDAYFALTGRRRVGEGVLR